MKRQPLFHSLVKPVRPVGKAPVLLQQSVLSRPSTSRDGGTTQGGFASQKHCLPLSTLTSHGWGPSADPFCYTWVLGRGATGLPEKLHFVTWAQLAPGTSWGMLMHYPLSRGRLDRLVQDTQCFSHPHEALIALEIYFKNKLFMTMSELRDRWKLTIQKPFWKRKEYA